MRTLLDAERDLMHACMDIAMLKHEISALRREIGRLKSRTVFLTPDQSHFLQRELYAIREGREMWLDECHPSERRSIKGDIKRINNILEKLP